uniref:Uncharacterized protein n=1 Tax=Amphimedon queenslandica TaxID=400682 RepID=A0A1X7TE58_AMPQE
SGETALNVAARKGYNNIVQLLSEEPDQNITTHVFIMRVGIYNQQFLRVESSFIRKTSFSATTVTSVSKGGGLRGLNTPLMAGLRKNYSNPGLFHGTTKPLKKVI